MHVETPCHFISQVPPTEHPSTIRSSYKPCTSIPRRILGGVCRQHPWRQKARALAMSDMVLSWLTFCPLIYLFTAACLFVALLARAGAIAATSKCSQSNSQFLQAYPPRQPRWTATRLVKTCTGYPSRLTRFRSRQRPPPSTRRELQTTARRHCVQWSQEEESRCQTLPGRI